MKHKQTKKELLKQANELDKEVAALDEHFANAWQGLTRSPAELAEHQKARDKKLTLASSMRKLAEERD